MKLEWVKEASAGVVLAPSLLAKVVGSGEGEVEGEEEVEGLDSAPIHWDVQEATNLLSIRMSISKDANQVDISLKRDGRAVWEGRAQGSQGGLKLSRPFLGQVEGYTTCSGIFEDEMMRCPEKDTPF